MVVYLLNSLVMPCSADYFAMECEKITLEEAKEILSNGFYSAVGHVETAKALTKLLGMAVPAQRRIVDMDVGELAVATQFLERIPEGKILTEGEVMDMYRRGKIVFRLIKRVK